MNHIFITGAAKGLGLEFTRQYLGQSHRVTAVVRDLSKAKKLLELKESFPERLQLIELDLRDTELETKLQKLGSAPIDLLINNAGVLFEHDEGYKTLSIQKIRDSIEVNTIVPLIVVRGLTSALSENSKIVNISSKMGSVEDCSSGFAYSYRVSKCALNMLTKSLSVELAKNKITAVVMHPGWVKTDMGGPGAPLDDHTSVSGMISVIEGLTLRDTGSFLQYDGKKLPW